VTRDPQGPFVSHQRPLLRQQRTGLDTPGRRCPELASGTLVSLQALLERFRYGSEVGHLLGLRPSVDGAAGSDAAARRARRGRVPRRLHSGPEVLCGCDREVTPIPEGGGIDVQQLAQCFRRPAWTLCDRAGRRTCAPRGRASHRRSSVVQAPSQVSLAGSEPRQGPGRLRPAVRVHVRVQGRVTGRSGPGAAPASRRSPQHQSRAGGRGGLELVAVPRPLAQQVEQPVLDGHQPSSGANGLAACAPYCVWPGVGADARQDGERRTCQRRCRRSAAEAACHPHIPWTPPPGGVEEEQRKTPGSGVA
jgi:hypothetical protein